MDRVSEAPSHHCCRLLLPEHGAPSSPAQPEISVKEFSSDCDIHPSPAVDGRRNAGATKALTSADSWVSSEILLFLVD